MPSHDRLRPEFTLLVIFKGYGVYGKPHDKKKKSEKWKRTLKEVPEPEKVAA
jgi:hypothetical protein